MQSPKNAAGVNGVKVRSVVNARMVRLVNGVANVVRVPSVVNVRPKREVSVVPVGHSLVGAVVRADQVVLCGCSR